MRRNERQIASGYSGDPRLKDPQIGTNCNYSVAMNNLYSVTITYEKLALMYMSQITNSTKGECRHFSSLVIESKWMHLFLMSSPYWAEEKIGFVLIKNDYSVECRQRTAAESLVTFQSTSHITIDFLGRRWLPRTRVFKRWEYIAFDWSTSGESSLYQC